jgi:hypothetical protein
MIEHNGSCHCGRIRLTLRHEPIEVSECNSSICRRTAGLWHYCAMELVSVYGKGVSYQQGDRALDTWHCPDCDCMTHWTPTDPTYQRMGVNLRMFEPDLWRDLPHRFVDGASY